MGSRDGDSFAGGGGSRSSGKNNNSPFVNNSGGYTWDGKGEWIYDGCNEIYPPRRYDAITSSHLPFNGRKPFSDSSGTHYFTPDENGHVYPSDEYGRYRSKSPEAPTEYRSSRLPTGELESNRRPGFMWPNPERLGPEPRDNSWKLEEEHLLVSLISEGRLTWAQMSMQFERHGEDSCWNYWQSIQVKYPDVHYLDPERSRPHLAGNTSPHRPERRA